MDYTYKEFEHLLKRANTVIIPVGSYEQHSSHLVLSTDSDIAEYFGNAVGQVLDIPVLPVLPYGISHVHKNFSGTVYLSEGTYLNVLSI